MNKKLLSTILVIQFIWIATVALAETIIDELPITIEQAGSYYVQGDFSVEGDGIIVDVANVTIDMRGYTITGDGTGKGVKANSNFKIYNGTIDSFNIGIYRTSGHSVKINNMSVINNTYNGITVYADNSILSDSIIAGNGHRGVDFGQGAKIIGNVVYDNVTSGISGDYGSTVINNTAYLNDGPGIDLGSGSTVIGNTSYKNDGSGLKIRAGSTVKNNTAKNNQTYGIKLSDNCLVDGNTATDNNQAEEEYPNMSSCTTCTFGTNHAP